MDESCENCEFWIRVTLRSGLCKQPDDYDLKTSEDEICDDYKPTEAEGDD